MADVLLGCRAASGAASMISWKSPLLMEYPDQPATTHHRGECQLGHPDPDSKSPESGWHMEPPVVTPFSGLRISQECGLVLSTSPHSWEIISKEKGVTTGGYMCQALSGLLETGSGCYPPCPDHWLAAGARVVEACQLYSMSNGDFPSEAAPEAAAPRRTSAMGPHLSTNQRHGWHHQWHLNFL